MLDNFKHLANFLYPKIMYMLLIFKEIDNPWQPYCLQQRVFLRFQSLFPNILFFLYIFIRWNTKNMSCFIHPIYTFSGAAVLNLARQGTATYMKEEQ